MQTGKPGTKAQPSLYARMADSPARTRHTAQIKCSSNFFPRKTATAPAGPTRTGTVTIDATHSPWDEKGKKLFPRKSAKEWIIAFGQTGVSGKARNMHPVHMEIKEGVGVPWKKHYPLKKETSEETKSILQKFLKNGLTCPYSFLYNTPILPVRKPHSNEYRFKTQELLMK